MFEVSSVNYSVAAVSKNEDVDSVQFCIVNGGGESLVLSDQINRKINCF